MVSWRYKMNVSIGRFVTTLRFFVVQLLTDKLYLHRIYRTISLRNECGRGKNYFYRLSVDSPTNNHYKMFNCGIDVRGCSHADDVSYLFKNMNGKIPPRYSMEYRTIQTLVRWNSISCFNQISFSHTIKPTGWRFHEICSRWKSKFDKFHSSVGTSEWPRQAIQVFQHGGRRGVVCWFPRRWSNEILGFIVCNVKWLKLECTSESGCGGFYSM